MDRAKRVLILGRSAPVLLESVDALRGLGYGANATNQFDSVLDEYDAREIDLVVFGGQVPAARRAQLESAMRARAPRIEFVSGLGGVARLLVAQVEEHFGGGVEGVGYDEVGRRVRVEVAGPAYIEVTGIWAVVSGSEPVARSASVFAGEVSGGVHTFVLSDEVPARGAFVSVRVGERVSVFRVAQAGPAGGGVGALPAPAPVSTRLSWELAPR